MKFIPTRTCISCRKKGAKENFIKIVRKNNVFKIVCKANEEGHGYYVCNNVQCVEKLASKKILNKLCKTDCGEEIYLKLKEYKSEQN